MGNDIDVIVIIFLFYYFEGEWDKFGVCFKIKFFMEGEKIFEGMDVDMRKVEVEEVEKVKVILNGDNFFFKVRIAVLDVIKLVLLRSDGYSGFYMYFFLFVDGIKERVQNDCVYWCLSGLIDIWNEIMLDIMKRWYVLLMK